MAARGFTVTPVLTEAQAQMALPMPPLAAPEPPARKAVRGGKNVKGQKAAKGQKATAKGGAKPASKAAATSKGKAANSKVRR
jgi:hypothetical protein